MHRVLRSQTRQSDHLLVVLGWVVESAGSYIAAGTAADTAAGHIEKQVVKTVATGVVVIRSHC